MRQLTPSLAVRLGVLSTVALLASVAIGASAGGPAKTTGSASALAVAILIPDLPPAESAASSSAGAGDAAGAFQYPEDGSVISVPSFSSSAAAGEGRPVAQGVADIPAATLFGGEVVLTGVAARAQARTDGTTVSGDAVGTAIAGVTVGGQPLPLVERQPIPIGDWGSLMLGETETAGSGTQLQIVVRSARLTLLAAHGGLPAGSQITLGTAIAEVELEEAPPTTTGTTTAAPPQRPRVDRVEKPTDPGPKRQAGEAPKQEREKLPVLKTPPDIDVTPELTRGGYVFPIFGQAWFSSTLGAARANTGWHHGTDIFAPFGAPVLAIADGTLFSVGWNKVGGYRLWLRDRQGNQFYYAHLAAYSQLARNGREVRAGQVIGFNGNTGDAQGTPFHVHFEVHPVGLLPLGYDGVVDPYRYLLAWRRLEDVSLSVGTGWAPPVRPTAKAPRPAAILLQSFDISTASGLEPGALERAAAGETATGTTLLDPASCVACESRLP